MSKSLLRYNASTAIYSVAFASWSDSHSGPKKSGFRYEGGVWKTTDPKHVGRLGSIHDHVLEATDAAVIAFDAARPNLPPEMASIFLIENGVEGDLLAQDAARTAEHAKFEFDHLERRRLAKEEFFAKRDRQMAGLDQPTGEHAEVVLRWDFEEHLWTVRHPYRGPRAFDISNSGFVYHPATKNWRSSNVFDVSILSSYMKHELGRLPATVEAAMQAVSLPLDAYTHDCYPVLTVVSTEADEDMRLDPSTMAHLAGADEGMISAAYKAMKILAAADDDHATRRNARGFGKAHGAIGHRLSELDSFRRSPYDDAFALKLARLHRKQLPAELDTAIGQARS